MRQPMTTPSVDPAPIRRVLLVRPRYLGDVCLTMPALDAVRAACPQALIAYVAERACASLLEGDPRVDELVVAPPKPGPAATAALIARLRRFAPEVAFDLFCNPRTAIWTFLSGARVRVRGRAGVPEQRSAAGFLASGVRGGRGRRGWSRHGAGWPAVTGRARVPR